MEHVLCMCCLHWLNTLLAYTPLCTAHTLFAKLCITSCTSQLTCQSVCIECMYCAVALQDLKAAVAGLLHKLQQTTEVQIKQRQPLVRKPAARAADIKQYNPQFEEEYVAGKDYDPDRYTHRARWAALTAQAVTQCAVHFGHLVAAELNCCCVNLCRRKATEWLSCCTVINYLPSGLAAAVDHMLHVQRSCSLVEFSRQLPHLA